MSRSAASTARSRAFLACVSALLSLGQLFALGHLLLVQHTVCAQHGDVHHSTDASGEKASAPAPVAGITSGDQASIEDHDHCDGWVRLDEMTPVVHLLPAATPAEQHPVDSAVFAAAATASIDLLALAPKLPPPLS
ncbi:MAG TPA: hypothetical protein PKD61_25705 [Polyangiaceae bacterium]|nr:hypothetical protein [Polyangiaceae bacterium]